MTALDTATLPPNMARRPPSVRTATVEKVRIRSGTPADPHAMAVHKALTFMRDHLSEPQGLTDHARAASLSPFHFHRVFKGLTGVTPGRFLTSLRLAEAKRMLLCSSMSSAYIGQFVGYLSAGTFTSQFTRLVGLPPRRFRVAARAIGGIPVTDVLARRAQHHPHAPGSVTVGVGSRPDHQDGCVALAAFRTAVPQDRPTTCAAVRAGQTIAIAGLDGARFILAFSLPSSGTVRQALMASLDTPGLYVASADLQAAPDSPQTDLEFRRLTPFDPPLLTAVPLLWRS
jgi:AraC family transcriptional regulator